MSDTLCRFCDAPLEAVFADLGSSPLANSYLPPERLGAMEPFYPLRALVCDRCFLVQLEELGDPGGKPGDSAVAIGARSARLLVLEAMSSPRWSPGLLRAIHRAGPRHAGLSGLHAMFARDGRPLGTMPGVMAHGFHWL